jgi:ectoine hydroxylase
MGMMSETTATLEADPYESRVGTEWDVVPRQDPVVWGSGEGPLPAAVLDQYAEQGYLAIQQLITPDEAATLLSEAKRLARDADDAAPDVIVEPESQTVRSLFRLHRRHEAFRHLAEDPRIVEVVRQILGSDVYVHQSRINFKPAFQGKEFFWHSDFETWHVEDGMPRMRAVSVSINLTENHEFNGPLMVVPGSHKHFIRCVGRTPENHFQQSLKKQQYGVPAREALEFLVAQGGIEAPKGHPGSAILFECNTMHGSVGNLSPQPRTNVFIVYNSVKNALVEPFGGLPPRPDFLAERDVDPVASQSSQARG